MCDEPWYFLFVPPKTKAGSDSQIDFMTHSLENTSPLD